MTALRWRRVAARAGRNDLPDLLMRHFSDLPLDDLPAAVRDAWVMAEWPERHAPRDLWLDVFEIARREDPEVVLTDEGPMHAETVLADIVDGDGMVTVYRGATPSRRDGMSWTTDLHRAEWFAHRFDGMPGSQETGALWRLRIPARFVLARFDGRGEDEIVLDMGWAAGDAGGAIEEVESVGAAARSLGALAGPMDPRGTDHPAWEITDAEGDGSMAGCVALLPASWAAEDGNGTTTEHESARDAVAAVLARKEA